MNKKTGVQDALHQLKEDSRDLSLAGVFDQIDISEVPGGDFTVSVPLKIKDQGNSDYCSAYASTSVSEDQESVELIPEYLFFKTKLLMDDFEGWGADLRTTCKAITKFGSIPEGTVGYHGLSRSEILNPKTWPAHLDTIAVKYKKETYFKVDGKYDIFDNIRCAMWQHRAEKRSILVGARWKDEWSLALGGIIPESDFGGGFGHAFKIFGQKMIGNQLYLVAQLSNGKDIGDGGIFYFPRSVVNRDFKPFGQYMFKDLPRSTAEFYQSNPITVRSPWSERILYFLKHLIINKT